ncbi:HNH endonuclease signature motif containing protein [Microbacterium wangchenii]|nr:HNH endonuclease signature motif containing protein [Microbacterium wangchenii]
MPSTAIRENRNDSVELARIVDGLCANQEAVAALEAEAVLHFAAGMRIALDRMATRPRPQQTREMELRAVAAEIGLALRLNDRTVQRRMGDALELTEKFPATVDGLSAGRITLRHAMAICDAGAVLEGPSERAAFETVVLDRAERETAARTRAFAVALAERMRPESVTVRFQRAVQTRRVTVAEIDDGMAEVRAILPAAEAFAVHDRLTRQARAIRAIATEPDGHTSSSPSEESATVRDTRTLDQIRADLFCDMLLTGQPAIDPAKDTLPGGLGAIRAEIQVTVPVLTAAGQDDRGASIEGKAPIDADTARRLMAGCPGWDRILTHPVTGMVLAVDRYRAGATMERFLAARDVHCRFPGCRQPARLCDHDHNLDWALGGTTDVCNMACLCRRHHTLKTETEWTAEQLPDGSIRWTSPLQRDYVDEPTPRVVFRSDGDPPPF